MEDRTNTEKFYLLFVLSDPFWDKRTHSGIKEDQNRSRTKKNRNESSMHSNLFYGLRGLYLVKMFELHFRITTLQCTKIALLIALLIASFS